MTVYYDKKEKEFRLMVDIKEAEIITGKKSSTLKKNNIKFVPIKRKQYADIVDILDEKKGKQTQSEQIMVDGIVELLTKLSDLVISVENVNLTLQNILGEE